MTATTPTITTKIAEFTAAYAERVGEPLAKTWIGALHLIALATVGAKQDSDLDEFSYQEVIDAVDETGLDEDYLRSPILFAGIYFGMCETLVHVAEELDEADMEAVHDYRDDNEIDSQGTAPLDDLIDLVASVSTRDFL